METASNADKEESQPSFGLDTRKTYESIIARKEARIAKEAQFERRARALTKHFLREHEEKESHKLDHLHEASQRSYERSMAKVQSGFNSDAMLREMFREENHQISQLMAERARQRELEEEKRQEAKAEREFYMQARMIHSQLQAEERQKKLEDMQRQRAENLKDRMKGSADRIKEKSQDKTEEKVSSSDKYEAEFEKVVERRKQQIIQHNKERHQQLSARAERERRALDERQKRLEQKQQEIRSAEEERHRKVQERRKMEEDELFKKIEQMNRRVVSSSAKVAQETPRSEPLSACTPRAPRPRLVSEKTDVPAVKEPDVESPKLEEKRGPKETLTFHSKDLIESNNLAHRDYVLRTKELDDTAQQMNVNKKYKALAEAAKELPDDYRSARLKVVHQAHMGSKTREARSPHDNSEACGPSQRTARKSPRALRCGLCMREFPPDRLVGSALRRTVERMRDQSSNLPNNKNDMAVMNSPRYHSESEDNIERRSSAVFESPAATKQPPSLKKKPSLYDYDVKLCVNCDIFVRITST